MYRTFFSSQVRSLILKLDIKINGIKRWKIMCFVQYLIYILHIAQWTQVRKTFQALEWAFGDFDQLVEGMQSMKEMPRTENNTS